jgi:hypothetical protein
MPTNEAPRRTRGLDPRRAALFASATLLAVSAACTAIVDRSTTQCHTDGDCAHFGGRPLCQGGLCVKSGFLPDDCFLGAPQQPTDFLNQCTTVACMSFDNCGRLGLCDGGAPDAALIPPPDAGTPAATADAGEGGAALPNCIDPTQGRANVVYITGSSNFPPLLSKLAPLVVAAGYTPVYLVTNSCRGVSSIMSPTASARTIADPAPGSTAKPAQYFGADGNPVSCALGGTVTVDVGESDIFASSCNGFTDDTPGVAEYLGPIQAMAFVVPAFSAQTTISAEAAREVFGMGGADGGAAPWTNPSVFFIRNQNTGTQQMIGRAIGVPADQFWGVDRGTAAAIDQGLRGIQDVTTANEAIGIISTDYYDADRSNLKALAFKAFGQECAYLPDTSPTKIDKQNVRDGHYPIWGPLHFFAAVENAVPVSPAAAAFTNTILVPAVQQSLLDAFIASSLVPSCAMRVTRTTELGSLSSYASPFQCGCYFDASVNGITAPASPPGCTRCVTTNDCTDPTRPACNLGFCETQPL